MSNKIKKIVLLSLAADFIASFIYISALQLQVLPLIICFYIISTILVLTSLLTCIKNLKKYKNNILLYMIFINILLIFVYLITLLYSK